MSKALRFLYKNYEGKSSERAVTPIEIVFVTDNFYHGTCWCMRAFDLGKEAERLFKLEDIQVWL